MSVKNSYRVLLLEAIHPVAQKRLEESGFYVERELKAFKGEELISRAQGFHAVGIRSKTQMKSQILQSLPDLEMIGAFCIGTNQIDLDHANALGVPVFNAPYSNTRSVAELMVCEMIALARQLGDRNMNAHKGVWQKSAVGANEIRGKTLGIVGYGHIGSQLSVLAEAMGLNVIYYDIVKKLPLGNATPESTLEDLLQKSDFVSFHVPETPLTKNMMGQKEIALMKKGAYLMNASRGTVVDISALATALETEHLAGAAVDVFPKEPASNEDLFTSELQNMRNVILTPHIGGSTEEAQEAIGYEVAESIIRYFKSGATSGAVNFPAVDVAMPLEGVPRIVNLHKNVPGVLGAINSIVSQCGGNIQAQHLSTDPHIGYLIMDMGSGDAEEATKKISELPTSLKTRLL
ncbi:MAG: phosphoglycerate dehydrogenase [Pseudobdellovibrionaceae bacterium]|nr:phosphoglycerate dehydrogenase [Bdellovibrionales bacterium]USN46215.1 MAG: phosphoglycerate dehydrogenase [Pseudobdellovibrionaceae bacterium]